MRVPLSIGRSILPLVFLAGACDTKAQKDFPPFFWPDGKKLAISLTFDDARESQVSVGTRLLDQTGIKATFFVVPDGVEKHLQGWKDAVASGHEVGNYSLVQPCSVHFDSSGNNSLEEYTLQKMRDELVQNNKRIKDLLGVKAEVFAYPCGQKFVGREENTQSYVPLIAKMFTAGRGWKDEALNDPVQCNFPQLKAIEMDGKNFEQVLALIEDARKSGHWLVLVGHEVGDSGRQTTRLDMLEQLSEYAKKPANGVWVAPMGSVAKYIQQKMGAISYMGKKHRGKFIFNAIGNFLLDVIGNSILFFRHL